MFSSRVLHFAKVVKEKVIKEKVIKVPKAPKEPKIVVPAPEKAPRKLTLKKVSPEMVSVLGQTEITSADALKNFWAYVKRNDFKKTEGNNAEYIADSKISSIIGRKTFLVKEVMGIVANSLIKEPPVESK